MKIKNIVVLIEDTSGDIRQVFLTNEEQDWVGSLINKLHEGKIKVSSKVLTSIEISKDE